MNVFALSWLHHYLKTLQSQHNLTTDMLRRMEHVPNPGSRAVTDENILKMPDEAVDFRENNAAASRNFARLIALIFDLVGSEPKIEPRIAQETVIVTIRDREGAYLLPLVRSIISPEPDYLIISDLKLPRLTKCREI
jgi:hypothetical protein